VESGRAVGVHVTEGETYTAGRAVIASVNADQLYLKLLADADVPRPLIQQAIRTRLRTDSTCVIQTAGLAG
jgi:hypothetical protein